jgi:hypothetical protein
LSQSAISTLDDWQSEEIKTALVEADQDDFTNEREVELILRKWTSGADSP